MTAGDGGDDSPMLSPEEAFGVLGNETRIAILRALGEADEPLSFTDLRNRVGIRQGAQFNYHLDKVVGHFVEKTGTGYALRQPGRRVVQAILSGAVTEDPTVEPTEIALACHHCGAPTEVSYDQGGVRLSCTACHGNYDESVSRGAGRRGEEGNLSNLALPSAGVQGRTPAELQRTAATWIHLEALTVAAGICPRCSAPVDAVVDACESHDAESGLCERCDRRHAVWVSYACTNCIFEEGFPAVMALLDAPELLAFVGDHGLNTTSRGIEWGWEYGEELLSTDPFEARFTFTVDGDSIALTVDGDFEVVEVDR